LTDEFRRFVPKLEANLKIFVYLRDHPGAPTARLPGKLDWLAMSTTFVDAAWKTAQQSTIIQYMPRGEVTDDDELYLRLQQLGQRLESAQEGLNAARRFSIVDPDPSHLSAAQIERQIDLTSEVLLRYALVGRSQKNLASRYQDFTPSLSRDDVYGILHATTDPDDQAALNALDQRLSTFEKKQESEAAR
jgi:hypothetical protein